MALLLAAGACRQEFDSGPDQLVATSSTLVSSTAGTAVYAVNVDEGAVSRFGLEDRTLQYVGVGAEPIRITRGVDRLYVSLRGDREVVALDDRAVGGLEITGRVTVGAEPYGIVASQDGGPVYVAVSLEDKVLELDPETLEIVRSWDVPDEPRWLALGPVGQSLFVSSFRNGRLSRIDLQDSVVDTLELPRAERGLFAESDESLPDSDASDWLTVRLTGDPCVTPDGTKLVVPTLYADTVAPVTEDDGDDGSGSGYGSDTVDVGRMNPSLVVFELEQGDEPSGWAYPIFVASDDDGVKRTPLTSVSCAPDNRYLVAAMEASDTVLVVDSHGFTRTFDDEGQGELEASFLGFDVRPLTEIGTRRGPSGMVFALGDLFIHTWLDRTVARASWEDAIEINALVARDSKLGQYPVLGTRAPVELIASALTAEVQEGRDLFTSALDSAMTTRQGGVSCSTCHVDGREDGLTWPFASGNRQTLSLAGRSDTGPFTWNGNVASIGEEARLTTIIRMGGEGPTDYELRLIETYVQTLRPQDTVNSLRNDALVTQGQDLFVSSGCAVCHAGELTTDGLNHLVYGAEPINTPSLVGIAATAPYLHDGSLPTLREVLALQSMADTSSLAAAELDALEAYLLSL